MLTKQSALPLPPLYHASAPPRWSESNYKTPVRKHKLLAGANMSDVCHVLEQSKFAWEHHPNDWSYAIEGHCCVRVYQVGVKTNVRGILKVWRSFEGRGGLGGSAAKLRERQSVAFTISCSSSSRSSSKKQQGRALPMSWRTFGWQPWFTLTYIISDNIVNSELKQSLHPRQKRNIWMPAECRFKIRGKLVNNGPNSTGRHMATFEGQGRSSLKTGESGVPKISLLSVLMFQVRRFWSCIFRYYFTHAML